MTVRQEQVMGAKWSSESDVWRSLKGYIPAEIFVRRIEDASGNLGTHDTYLASRGKSAWLELKFAGPNAAPRMRKGQYSFGAKLLSARVMSGYLVGSPDGSIRLLDQMTLGRDWRDHLIFRKDVMDAAAVRAVFEHLGLS
jgi:hypothetical protein